MTDGKSKKLAVLLFFVAVIATAEVANQPDAAISHVQTYLEQMQLDMEAIEKELDPELRHALMREHMESMAKAMAIMENEMLPYMQNRVGLHASGKRRIDAGSDDTEIASGNGSADELSIDEAVEMMDEAIVLRQMEAILEQMSRHRQALQDTQD